MIEGAAEVVALADHDKLGTAMPVVVAPLSAVTQLVTDADADDDTLTPYRALGIEVLHA
jgi:DeoR/GlpR family transcriptional regulator of sugar metabolism